MLVTFQGSSTSVSGVPVLQAQPGIHNFTGANGHIYGYVISGKDGSTVTENNPAVLGFDYYVIVTGLGQTTPPAVTDVEGVSGQNVIVPVLVGVNNQGMPVISAEYLPGWNGFYIIHFTLPQGTTLVPGLDQPFVVAAQVNGQNVFSNPLFTVYLPVTTE